MTEILVKRFKGIDVVQLISPTEGWGYYFEGLGGFIKKIESEGKCSIVMFNLLCREGEEDGAEEKLAAFLNNN